MANSVSRPRLLDLFCGAGGAAVGYHRAGFEVVGVDIAPQPHYPYEFWQMDALDAWPQFVDFNAIHASPPCQGYSRMNRIIKREYPMLIEPVRHLLARAGRPYVIENVEGAPLVDALTLCGTMFGLPVRRHRLFEVRPLPAALQPACTCGNGVADGRLVGARARGPKPANRRVPPPRSDSAMRDAIGVEWMTVVESMQAIPPAYCEWIGAHLLAAVEGRVG
jgi:DNA (cytosine-5)-methyltransferase 1